MILILGLPTLFETRVADDAAALWLLEDEAFVSAAVSLTVDGEASANDLADLVMLLRLGYSKHYVLVAIADRWGTAFKPGKLPGIRRRLNRYRLGQLPLIGWLIRSIFRFPGETVLERRLRVVENQLYLVAKLMAEHDVGRGLPAAPWGGLHRSPLLKDMLLLEAGMAPEAKAIYGELLSAAYQHSSSASSC